MKGAKGSLSRTRTVDSSGVSMLAITSYPTLVNAPNFGLATSSQVNFTSLDVKGLPSCHVTPFRSLTVYSSPFLEMPPFFADGISVARFGMNCAFSSVRHRLSNRPKWTPRSTSMCGRSGLKTVGSCESATTTCPPFLGACPSTMPGPTIGPSRAAAPVPAKIPSTSRRDTFVITIPLFVSPAGTRVACEPDLAAAHRRRNSGARGSTRTSAGPAEPRRASAAPGRGAQRRSLSSRHRSRRARRAGRPARPRPRGDTRCSSRARRHR